MWEDYRELDNFIVKTWIALIVIIFGIVPSIIYFTGHPVATGIYIIISLTLHTIFCQWNYKHMHDIID